MRYYENQEAKKPDEAIRNVTSPTKPLLDALIKTAFSNFNASVEVQEENDTGSDAILPFDRQSDIQDHIHCANVLKKRKARMRRHKHKKRLRKNRYKSK